MNKENQKETARRAVERKIYNMFCAHAQGTPLVEQICTVIRESNLSDSEAGLIAQIVLDLIEELKAAGGAQ